VPVLGQREAAAGAVVVTADGPDIARAIGVDRFQVVVVGAAVGAGRRGPGGAIPVLDERLVVGAVVIITGGPDVVAGAGADAVQFVGIAALVGAGADGPGGAVPVFDQGMADQAAVVIEPGGPDVVAGEGADGLQLAAVGALVRAADDRPVGAVVVLDERLI